MSLKVGDIVWLKSGGPPMTVTNIEIYPPEIELSWFTEQSEIRQAQLRGDALTMEVPKDVDNGK